MGDRPFEAILPKRFKTGDEIILKGKISDNAKVFSVNFVEDSSEEVVAYQFKTDFTKNTVTQSYKAKGEWYVQDEWDEKANTWIDGPGREFVLTFFVDEGDFVVYSGDQDRMFQYKFQIQFEEENIERIQVLDDVDFISEIVFRYKNGKN